MSAPTAYGELADLLDALPLLLKEARCARRLSQRAAAQQIGCSFPTICRMEQGKDGNLSNAKSVLRWLGEA